MKKVLFDGTAMQPSTKASFHGGSEYAKVVFFEALKRGYTFDIVFRANHEVPKDVQNILDSSPLSINGLNQLYVTNKRGLYALLEGDTYDAFYSALPYNYFDYNGDTPIIGVIHGLRNIEFPWDIYYHKFIASIPKRLVGWLITKFPATWKLLKRRHKRRLGRLINCPKFRFITVSEHSKYALLNFFPALCPESILVCYSPINLKTPKTKLDNFKSDYYLLVSGNRAEKNIFRAVKSFDKLMSDGRLTNKHVVITGVPDARVFDGIRNRKKFKFLPYISKANLDRLFQNAYCFVYPSLNEGFGYPPLQAMSVGVPVVASSATSIPEVCGSAALYFSPTNLDDLCDRILQVEYNSSLYANLKDNGIRRIEELKQIQENGLNKQLDIIFN